MGVDRHVMAGRPAFQASAGLTYFEKNCVEPNSKRLCIYETVKGKILKTVDSVYQVGRFFCTKLSLLIGMFAQSDDTTFVF